MSSIQTGQSAPKPQELLMQSLMGVISGRALSLAADLGIADLLKDGPQTAADVATRLGANEDAVYRLLRALSVPGFFEALPERRFALTPLSQLLRSDVPGSMRAMVAHMGFSAFWHAFAEIEHTLRTGKPAFDKAVGMPVFEYFSKNERESKVFDQAMTQFTAMTAEPVAKAYDFAGVRTLVDVGGGHGGLLAAIVKRHPSVQATLYDLSHVTESAPAHLEAQGLKGKIAVESGSFFERVPSGADAYIMKAIIHDWDDARCLKILENCRKAMAPGGRILIVEQVVTDRPESAFAKLSDIVMMLLPGGRERTAEEFDTLLGRAGLKLTRIVPTESPVSVIDARVA